MAITPKQQDAVNLYYVLMAEARYRLDFIHAVDHGHIPAPSFMTGEMCYLQLRMLCESIALASLVAHGDFTQPMMKKFEQEYAADKIIKMMEALNQDFFPQQAEIKQNHGVMAVNANTKPNALKRDELVKLYRHCGDRLHRGRVKVVTKFDPAKHGHYDKADIVFWFQKVEDLLGLHIMPLFVQGDQAAVLICSLRDANKNLETTVNRVELSMGGAPPK